MLDLITGHQGFLHITAEQISEVNRSITAGYGDNAVLRLKDGNLSSTGLSIGIAAGYWRANGFDVEITSAETIYVDPSSVGTSRIDKFYIELLQDIPSGNQRAELVYVKGTEASVPVAPSDPTAPALTTDILLECVCYASALIEENALTLTDLTKVIQNVTPEDMTLVKSWIRNNADVYSSLVTHDKGEIVLNALDGKIYECVHSCPAYSWESNSQYYEERTIIDILDRINQQAPDFHKYGTCPTAASTSEKKITTRLGDWKLETGKVVYVAFSYTNTAATPTLNIDNTGAKEIKGYGSTAPSSWWQAGDKVQFLYDGVYYIMLPSQGQITQLNNDLLPLKHTESKATSGYTLNSNYGYKSGGWQHIHFEMSIEANIKSAMTAETYFTIAFLPNKPKRNLYLPTVTIDGVAINAGMFIISTGTNYPIQLFVTSPFKSYNGTSVVIFDFDYEIDE